MEIKELNNLRETFYTASELLGVSLFDKKNSNKSDYREGAVKIMENAFSKYDVNRFEFNKLFLEVERNILSLPDASAYCEYLLKQTSILFEHFFGTCEMFDIKYNQIEIDNYSKYFTKDDIIVQAENLEEWQEQLLSYILLEILHLRGCIIEIISDSTYKSIIDPIEKRGKSGLTLAEQLLIIVYLQDEGMFPKRGQIDQIQFHKFLGSLFDKDHNHAGDSFERAEMIAHRTPTQGQARNWRKSLSNIRPIIESWGNLEILKKIDQKILELGAKI